ncbi:SUMF1/EgtB/PvdO family nonheme iron enzyme [Planctomycetota bacterium]
MEFLAQWRYGVQKWLVGWGKAFEVGSAHAIYGTLAASSLLPIYEAVQNGASNEKILGAAYTLAGVLGANLVAGRLGKWRDTAMTEPEFIQDVTDSLDDPVFREQADEIVEKLDVFATVVAEVPSNLQESLRQILSRELEQLGNLSRFAAVLGDNSVAIQGDHNKQVQNGQLIEGDVAGDAILNSTVDKSTTVIQFNKSTDNGQPKHLNFRNAYLRHLHNTAKHIPLQSYAKEEAEKGQSLVELSAIYTALGTRELEHTEEVERQDPMDRIGGRPQRYLSAFELVHAYDHVVLLGDPGSGKSTFVKYLVLCMTGDMLEEKDINLEILTSILPGDEETDKASWRHGQLLPIFIELRDFAVKALPAPGKAGSACHVWKYLRDSLKDWGIPEYFEGLKQEVLDKDKTSLLVFDGLDEVPDPHNQRKQIKEAIEDFARTANCRMIVTSRTYAYLKQDWELEGFHAAELASFNEDQIRSFIKQWYDYQAQTTSSDKEDARGRAKLLQDAVFEKKRRLQGLAERPLLLTLMAVLHSWHGRDLPEKRVEIYEQTLDLLIHRWNSRKETLDGSGRSRLPAQDVQQRLRVSRTELRALLEKLAFEAHRRQSTGDGCADVPKKDLVAGLYEIGKDGRIKDWEDFLMDRVGILIERGHDVFTFPHRTFQEYLAACYLTRVEFPEKIAELTRQDPQRWREVTQLVGLKVNTAHSGWALVEYLQRMGRSNRDAWGTLIAAEFLVESDWRWPHSEIEAKKLKKVCQRLAKVLANTKLPAVERALAGRLLAQLGDPRREVVLPEAMVFSEVPAGPFWMGAAEHDVDADDRERPGFENCLDYGFYLARYPVSNAQYRCFIEAGAFHKDEYWLEAIADGRWKDGKLKVTTWSYPEFNPKSEAVCGPADYDFPINLGNHPAVGVSWYEAMAYCRWLTEHLKASKVASSPIQKLREENWHVTLPSEAEWEKAARGMEDRRTYPWGDEEDPNKANYSDTKIGTPSALGCFPRGQSPYECKDMAGNVWEWCRTPWQENFKNYINEPDSSEEEKSRVLRGGAFFNYRYHVRCSYRYGYDPNYRYYDIGFRVCVCPHFSEL